MTNEMKQGVSLTERNTSGPPWIVGRPTARASGGRPACRQCYRRRQATENRRQTPTDASEQNNTGPLGGPVIIKKLLNSLKETLTKANISDTGNIDSSCPISNRGTLS